MKNRPKGTQDQPKKKLVLKPQTVRQLTTEELDSVVGGFTRTISLAATCTQSTLGCICCPTNGICDS